MSEEIANFLPAEPYSLRPVCQHWVKQRAVELGGRIEDALLEVVEHLYVRTSHNNDDSRQVLVYSPSGEQDPYVIALPLINHKKAVQDSVAPPARPCPVTPDNRKSNVREEFEDLLFVERDDLTPSALDKDEQGNYLDPTVNTLWQGFRLYHRRLTIESKPAFREQYQKILGRYVLAKVSPAGVPLFNRTPFRHATRAKAYEEASRLSSEVGEAFGVFRCLDIVGKPFNS